MVRSLKLVSAAALVVAAAALLAACGTQKISLAKSDPNYRGAVLFSQRCAGCHTLGEAGTHGSASNVRTREIVNGPNFNVRCERPVDRVLYAIANGGFSGAIMPQNIVVGKDAQDVAKFVAQYAGSKAPKIVGQSPCGNQPVGTPTPIATATP